MADIVGNTGKALPPHRRRAGTSALALSRTWPMAHRIAAAQWHPRLRCARGELAHRNHAGAAAAGRAELPHPALRLASLRGPQRGRSW
jgi:hypothetical protein